MEAWTNDFYAEEEQAIRGLGKYRLAPGYDHLKVDPVVWNKWGPDWQAQHLLRFQEFSPKSYNTYHKPSSAGLKSAPVSKSRSAKLPEAQMFLSLTTPKPRPDEVVTPIKIYKDANSRKWEVTFFCLARNRILSV